MTLYAYTTDMRFLELCIFIDCALLASVLAGDSDYLSVVPDSTTLVSGRAAIRTVTLHPYPVPDLNNNQNTLCSHIGTDCTCYAWRLMPAVPVYGPLPTITTSARYPLTATLHWHNTSYDGGLGTDFVLSWCLTAQDKKTILPPGYVRLLELADLPTPYTQALMHAFCPRIVELPVVALVADAEQDPTGTCISKNVHFDILPSPTQPAHKTRQHKAVVAVPIIEAILAIAGFGGLMYAKYSL